MDPLLLIVIFGLVGFVFWIFIKNRKSTPKVSSPSNTQIEEKPKEQKAKKKKTKVPSPKKKVTKKEKSSSKATQKKKS
mgnify:FL=1